MDGLIRWLPDAGGTPWELLAKAMNDGLPVPAGYIVCRSAPEEQVRAAYEQLKARELTHYLAVRGSSHAMLNVIGPDALIHTLRRLWSESPDAPVFVQRMIHSMWCGKAYWHRKNLRVRVNEGMMILDPDTYLVVASTGKCLRRTLEPKQRKMLRHVDGSARVVIREGARAPIPAEHLVKVAALAVRAGTDIGWAIDDLEKIWLLRVA
jgi:hypothetical protein